MRKVLVLCAFLFSGLSYSEEKPADNHPCKKLVEACNAGGYQQGHHKKDGKGLHIDCLQKLKKGEAVEGVTVDAADVSACKAKREEHKKK